MTNRPLDIEYLPIYYVTGHRIAARALIARRNVHSVDLRSPTECTFRRPMRACPIQDTRSLTTLLVLIVLILIKMKVSFF